MLTFIRQLMHKATISKGAVYVIETDEYWEPACWIRDGTVYKWQQIKQNRWGAWYSDSCWVTDFGKGATVTKIS